METFPKMFASATSRTFSAITRSNMFDFEIDLALSTFDPRAMPMMPFATWTVKECLENGFGSKFPRVDVVVAVEAVVAVDVPDLAPDPEVVVVADVVDPTEPDLLLRLKISAHVSTGLS